MAYGKIKADTLVYDNSGTDTDVTIASLGNKADLASPTFTGTVTIPTPTSGDNSTKAASTAFVVAGFAPKPASAGTVAASETVQVDANKDITGFRNVTLSGDLTVNGTTTTIDSTTLTVEDKNIELGKVDTPTDTTADGGGITLKGATDKTFNWVDATDAWTSSEHIHLGDDKKLLVGGASGTHDGIEIYHDASKSVIADTGTGSLFVAGSSISLTNAAITETMLYAAPDGAVTLYHDNSAKLATSATGVTVTGSVVDTKGDLRTIPQNYQTSAYTLSGSDAGKHIYYSGSAAAITVPSGQFNVGDAVTIISGNSSADITIVQSGTTIHNAADAATGTRTLAPKGMATLICVASNVFSISGAGLS